VDAFGEMKRLRRTGLPRDSSDPQDYHLDDERIDDEPAENSSARRPRKIKLQEGARRSAGKPGTEKIWQVPLIVPEPVEFRYPQSMLVEPARLEAGPHEVSLTLLQSLSRIQALWWRVVYRSSEAEFSRYRSGSSCRLTLVVTRRTARDRPKNQLKMPLRRRQHKSSARVSFEAGSGASWVSDTKIFGG